MTNKPISSRWTCRRQTLIAGGGAQRRALRPRRRRSSCSPATDVYLIGRPEARHGGRGSALDHAPGGAAGLSSSAAGWSDNALARELVNAGQPQCLDHRARSWRWPRQLSRRPRRPSTVVHGRRHRPGDLLQEEEVAHLRPLLRRHAARTRSTSWPALIAQRVGVSSAPPRMVQRADHIPIYRELGIDASPCRPATVASDHILRFSRGEAGPQPDASSKAGKAEVVELTADARTAAPSAPLCKSHEPAPRRPASRRSSGDGEVIIPQG